MKPSIYVLTLFVTGWLLGVPAAGQPADAALVPSPRNSSWHEIVTPDFIVTGNAPTGALRSTLVELTRFRDSLAKLFPQAVLTSPVPSYVVVLSDRNAFQKFAPRDSRGKTQENVGGYFTRSADANLIVLPASRGSDSLETIFHEYTHYFVARNVHTAVPMWLNEGLADFYSTFRGDYCGKTLVGSIPAERWGALKSSTFLPLRDIVSPKDLESTWRWDRQIELFYAESWALVHYLIIGRQPSTPSPLNTYLTSLARTGDQDRAFREAFGTDVAGMEREVRAYVRVLNLNAMAFDFRADTKAASEIRSLSEADVNALEGRVLLEVNAFAEAERKLTQAIKQQPTHAAAQIALARLRLTQDREDEAIAALQRVVAANEADATAQYYLGVALGRAWRHEEALAAFAKAVRLTPRNPPFWTGMNAASLALGRDAQGAAALQNALQYEWSPSYYWNQGIEALRLGRDDVAATSIATYVSLGADEDRSVYSLFVRAVAAWRAGHSDEAEAALALAEKADSRSEWTRSVLRYLQGRLDEAQFLRAARSAGEQTEAHTYIGFKQSIAGRADDAAGHFRWVSERGARNYLEYELARNELNRLKYRKQPPAIP